MHRFFMPIILLAVTLQAEPAKEQKTFEADTDGMSKEEVRAYMGRSPDVAITPHLWRYRGSWTNSMTMESFSTVDMAFGMLTDSHKYGVVRYTWDNDIGDADSAP